MTWFSYRWRTTMFLWIWSQCRTSWYYRKHIMPNHTKRQQALYRMPSCSKATRRSATESKRMQSSQDFSRFWTVLVYMKFELWCRTGFMLSKNYCATIKYELLLHLVYENCLITSHITALVHDVIIYGQDRFMVNQYAICHCSKLLENTGNSAVCVNLWKPGENSFCQQDNNPNHKVKLTLRVK